jgi:hypothetical protein
MPDIQAPQKFQELPVTIVKNMVALSTSGFGLVVALAWNEFVRKFVESYIDPYLGKNSGLLSLFIYAVVITLLAIIVTMQLTGLQRKAEMLHERVRQRAETKKEKLDKNVK